MDVDMRLVLREICDLLDDETRLMEQAKMLRNQAEILAKQYNIPLKTEFANAPKIVNDGIDWDNSGCSTYEEEWVSSQKCW